MIRFFTILVEVCRKSLQFLKCAVSKQQKQSNGLSEPMCRIRTVNVFSRVSNCLK